MTTLPGALVVSAANPRYFAVAGDEYRAVYLTGSHIWNNLHDGMGAGAACADTPKRLDFGDYLDFLEERSAESTHSSQHSSRPATRWATPGASPSGST